MKQKQQQRERRKVRVRARLFGSATRPRLTVKRSLRHLFVQLIDDSKGHTLLAASDRDVKNIQGKPVVIAREVGKVLGERAKAMGIHEAVFDRGSYRYQGRIASLADGVREAGINM